LAKLLYKATKWGEQEPMIWGEEQEKASKENARILWLTPVILATQEAEIRRITVQSQPRKIVHETLS
jgi:hypothetical protein